MNAYNSATLCVGGSCVGSVDCDFECLCFRMFMKSHCCMKDIFLFNFFSSDTAQWGKGFSFHVYPGISSPVSSTTFIFLSQDVFDNPSWTCDSPNAAELFLIMWLLFSCVLLERYHIRLPCYFFLPFIFLSVLYFIFLLQKLKKTAMKLAVEVKPELWVRGFPFFTKSKQVKRGRKGR